jgi:hypothetical protein
MRTRFAVVLGVVVLASLGWSALASAGGGIYLAGQCTTTTVLVPDGSNCRTDVWQLPADRKQSPKRLTASFCSAAWASLASTRPDVFVEGRYGTSCAAGIWRLSPEGVRQVPAPEGARRPIVSPDDTRLAVWATTPMAPGPATPESQLWVMDLDGKAAHIVDRAALYEDVRWTADDRLVFAEFPSRSYSSIAASGEPGSRRTVAFVPSGSSLALSPDLTHFALRSFGVLVVGSLRGAGGKVVSRIAGQAQPVWQRGGESLLFSVLRGSASLGLVERSTARRGTTRWLSGLGLGAQPLDAPSPRPAVTARADVAAPAVVLVGDGDAVVAGRGRGPQLVTRGDALSAAVIDPSGLMEGSIEVRRGAKVLRKLGFYDPLSLSAALNKLPIGRYRITFRVTDGAVHTATVGARVKIVD